MKGNLIKEFVFDGDFHSYYEIFFETETAKIGIERFHCDLELVEAEQAFNIRAKSQEPWVKSGIKSMIFPEIQDRKIDTFQ